MTDTKYLVGRLDLPEQVPDLFQAGGPDGPLVEQGLPSMRTL